MSQSERMQPRSSDGRDDKTLVYLVRHGVTEWNVQRRFQGQLDVPLSKEGEEQARAVADWLSKQPVHFQAIYSSDLSRAAQTASVIGATLGIDPQFSTALREINCGEWQGLSIGEVEDRYPGQLRAWDEKGADFVLPGGECERDVQSRVYAFYREITEKHRGQAIIIVSHGLALSGLQAALMGWEIADARRTKRGRLGNAGVTALSVGKLPGESVVLFANSTIHLPPASDITTVADRD